MPALHGPSLHEVDASVTERRPWRVGGECKPLIRSFFDTIDHGWLQKFVEHRIGDKRMVRLLMKWVHAGVMEEGKLHEVAAGTPERRIRLDGRSWGRPGCLAAEPVVQLAARRNFEALLAVCGSGEQQTTANAFYNDEREQFFSNSLHPELYSDRLTATSLSFGAGVGILDNLEAYARRHQTYVRDPVDYDKLLLTTDVGVRTAVSPHFGLASPARFAFGWTHLVPSRSVDWHNVVQHTRNMECCPPSAST